MKRREPRFGRMVFENSEIKYRCRELAGQIIQSIDLSGPSPVLVGVMKGALPFMVTLSEYLPPVEWEFVIATSYGNSLKSTGVLKTTYVPPADTIKNRDVILVEDIVDTGLTLNEITALLNQYEPKSLRVVTLLKRKGAALPESFPSYVGFQVPEDAGFLVGFGLDYQGCYRDLKNIYSIKDEST